MASIDCVIDTEPMAASINRVSKHVDATTAAVVAMQTATVAAERAAAALVCGRIDAGFHSLILSQLSQRAARAKAIVDSKIAQLAQQGQLLARLRDQMEMDFHRIKGRYTQLFRTLDQTLALRIAELDRGVFDMVHTQRDRLLVRPASMGVLPLTHQSESVPLSHAVSMARMRHSSRAMIASSSAIIDRGVQLRQTIREATRAQAVGERRSVLIPVLYASWDRAPNVPVGVRTEVPPFLSDRHDHFQRLVNRLDSAVTTAPPPDVSSRIMTRAKALVATRGLPPRVVAMLTVLIERQRWQVAVPPSGR